jgi:hypothetical protein
MRWYGVDRETTRHSDGFDGGDEVGLHWGNGTIVSHVFVGGATD